MKRILTILAFTISLSICHAQEAVYLVSNPNTARWSYIETDSHGKMTATIFNSVESIAGDAVNGNIKMLVEEVPVASPKDTRGANRDHARAHRDSRRPLCRQDRLIVLSSKRK